MAVTENKCMPVDCRSQPTDIPEYADISGLGVLLGFLVAAYLVILFLIGYYVFAFDPRLDVFRGEDDTATVAPTINIVDDLVLRKVHHVLRKTREVPLLSYLWNTGGADPSRGKEFHRVMNQCVYALVDSQSITGIAVLASGYYSLHCGVSSYHWYLIVYLAWFASLTHLSGLTFLRNHLHNHQGARSWRLFCMFVLLVLLAVALFPTAHFDIEYIRYNGGNIIDNKDREKEFRLTDHAVCYFKIKEEKYGMLPDRWDSMVVSMGLLVYGYLLRALKLFNGTRGAWYRAKQKWKDWCQRFFHWFAGLPSDRCPDWFRFTYGALCVKPWVWLYLLLRCLLHYYVSMASEIYWLLVSASWGTSRLFFLKFSNGAPKEDDWTFGQLVPLLMLASPLVLIYEYLAKAVKATWARKKEERKMSSRDLETEPRQKARPLQEKIDSPTIPEASHQEAPESGEQLFRVPRQDQQEHMQSDSGLTLVTQSSSSNSPPPINQAPSDQFSSQEAPLEQPSSKQSSSAGQPSQLPTLPPLIYTAQKRKSPVRTFFLELCDLFPEPPTDYLHRVVDLPSYLDPALDRSNKAKLLQPGQTSSFHSRNNTHTKTSTQTSPSYQSAFLVLLMLAVLGDSVVVLLGIFLQPEENIFTADSSHGTSAKTLAVQFVAVQLLGMLCHMNTCHALGRVEVLRRRKGWRILAYGVVTALALAAMFVLGPAVLFTLMDEWEDYLVVELSVVGGTVASYVAWYVAWGVLKARIWGEEERRRGAVEDA